MRRSYFSNQLCSQEGGLENAAFKVEQRFAKFGFQALKYRVGRGIANFVILVCKVAV